MMAVSSTLQVHVSGKTVPKVRHSTYNADSYSGAFEVSKFDFGELEITIFTHGGAKEALAAALRELAHQIDGGRPVVRESA